MKALVLTLACFLFLVNIASAALLEVGVKEKLEATMNSILYENSSNTVRFSFEFYNTGSVPYKARIRNDVSNGNVTIFTGWSQEKDMMPGDKKTFDIYWYADSVGDYSSKVRVYFGNEVKEYKKVDLTISDFVDSEDVFEIRDFRTYDNYVVFDIMSTEDLESLVIIPQKYTAGWVFEQKELVNVSKESWKPVTINYYPSLWNPSNISLGIVANNGKYYSEKELEMKKIGGITGLYYYITDAIKLAFFK